VPQQSIEGCTDIALIFRSGRTSGCKAASSTSAEKTFEGFCGDSDRVAEKSSQCSLDAVNLTKLLFCLEIGESASPLVHLKTE
jgi:hypothetical protein